MKRNLQALTFPFESKLMGGLVGLLVGDSLGVPYEFHAPEDLPAPNLIEMTPPAGFARTYARVPPGTWSDDGAQALCLLGSLLYRNTLDMGDFGARLLQWLDKGYMTPDGHVFDCGGQTRAALWRLKVGPSTAHDSGGRSERENGNGSLMRSLPLALWHRGSDAELVRDAHTQSLVTHAHVRSQVCCALYCLWARELLMNDEQESKTEAWDIAAQKLTSIYMNDAAAGNFPEESMGELQTVLCYGNSHRPQGHGYVVDSLWSARQALQARSYEDVVRAAIQFGHDTDTTACIAGGLAGIRHGIDKIPERWKIALRGKEVYFPLLEKLLVRQVDISNPPRRIIEMVAALLDMGYQRLRFYPYVGPAMCTRFVLTVEQPCHRYNQDKNRTFHFSPGGTFGWGDTALDTPKILAQKLLSANPIFAELAYGPDPAYAEWFRDSLKMLGSWKAFTFWQEVDAPFTEDEIMVQTDDGTYPFIPYPPGHQPIVW